MAVKSVLKPFTNVFKTIKMVHTVKPLSKYQQFAAWLNILKVYDLILKLMSYEVILGGHMLSTS